MTLKYPSSGYGMSAPSAQTNVINKLAAANNAKAATSAWSPVTLKGATGNTLYPAPKTSSSASLGSSFPSLKDLHTAVPRASTSYPSVSYPKLPTTAAPKTTSLPPPSWATGGVYGGQPTAAPSRVQMPQGFAGPALSQAAPQATSRAAPLGAAATLTPMQAPASAQAASSPPPAAAPSTQSREAQMAAAQQRTFENAQAQYGGGAPRGSGTYATKEEAAYHAGAYNPGNNGRSDYTYGQTNDGRWIVNGPSAAKPQRPAQQPPIAVGRPTQTGQPVAAPVIPARAPTQDEIDTANQGRWLA